MITVFTARGIGEQLYDPNQMCRQVTDRLDPNIFRVVEVQWAATYGPVGPGAGLSFDQALAEGRNLVFEGIDFCRGPYVLLGYSGGATLMGNVAAEIGRVHGTLRASKARGVALISDPHQPRRRRRGLPLPALPRRRLPRPPHRRPRPPDHGGRAVMAQPPLEDVRELLEILYADDDPETMADNLIHDGWRKQ